MDKIMEELLQMQRSISILTELMLNNSERVEEMHETIAEAKKRTEARIRAEQEECADNEDRFVVLH